MDRHGDLPMNKSLWLRGKSNEFVTELSSLAAQAVFHERAVALLFLRKDALVVGFSCAQQMKQNASQFVSGGGNGLGGSQTGAHPAIVRTQIRLAAVQGLGGNPQGPVHSITRPAGFAGQDLAAALFVVGGHA